MNAILCVVLCGYILNGGVSGLIELNAIPGLAATVERDILYGDAVTSDQHQVRAGESFAGADGETAAVKGDVVFVNGYLRGDFHTLEKRQGGIILEGVKGGSEGVITNTVHSGDGGLIVNDYLAGVGVNLHCYIVGYVIIYILTAFVFRISEGATRNGDVCVRILGLNFSKTVESAAGYLQRADITISVRSDNIRGSKRTSGNFVGRIS